MPRKTRKKQKEYQKKETYQDNKLRVPRPLGFTYLAINNQKQGKGTKELRDKTIQIWISNNYQLNNKEVNITEMASYLNMTTQTLMREMNREVERISNFFDSDEGRRLARVQWNLGLKKSLEILNLTQHQVALLMAQQGNEYVPFLTGEVNRSLTNLINAQKPTHDLLKMLTEKNNINIILNGDKQSETSGQHYLSPEQARIMIAEHATSLLNNPAAIEAKELELGSLPDVNARNQDLTKIGVRNSTKSSKDIIHIDNANIHNNRHDRVPTEVHDASDFIA